MVHLPSITLMFWIFVYVGTYLSKYTIHPTSTLPSIIQLVLGDFHSQADSALFMNIFVRFTSSLPHEL